MQRGMTALTPAAIEHLLDQARLELFADLRKASPDPGIVDVFCIKYDYHNAKVLLKAAAMGTDPAGLFIDAGRCPVRQLREDFEREDLDTALQCSGRPWPRPGACWPPAPTPGPPT